MKLLVKFVSFALLLFGYVQCSVLPVEKCTLTDKACLLPAFKKMLPIFTAGMPEYGVGISDPLLIKDFRFDMAGLQFNLTNWNLKGFKVAVIDDVSWNVKRSVFRIEFHTDLHMTGHYVAAGNILSFPIEGDGALVAAYKNSKIKMNIYYDKVNKNGKDYLKLTKYAFDYDVIDGIDVELENLFNGNQAESDALINFIKTNWKLLITTFGRPVFNIILSGVYKNISKFFDHIPIGDIANLK